MSFAVVAGRAENKGGGTHGALDTEHLTRLD